MVVKVLFIKSYHHAQITTCRMAGNKKKISIAAIFMDVLKSPGYSGGCITVAHWARGLAPAVAARVTGALPAAPPDFERPMPDGYPSGAELAAAGWLPVPRARLPFPCIVASSRNDPLGAPDRVAALARDWGAPVVDAGAVGHLNPASGYGPWPEAHRLIDRLRPCAAVAPEH